ncbi:MAG TPA: hypothetical protein VF384_08020 [Planctomycetota bacterium]
MNRQQELRGVERLEDAGEMRVKDRSSLCNESRCGKTRDDEGAHLGGEGNEV